MSSHDKLKRKQRKCAADEKKHKNNEKHTDKEMQRRNKIEI